MGRLRIDYATAQYTAAVAPNPDFHYPIFYTCDGNTSLFGRGPFAADALSIGNASGGGRELPFGTNTLAGSQAGVVDPTANFNWNLK